MRNPLPPASLVPPSRVLEATVKIYSDGRVPQLFYNLSLSLSLSLAYVSLFLDVQDADGQRDGRTGRRTGWVLSFSSFVRLDIPGVTLTDADVH